MCAQMRIFHSDSSAAYSGKMHFKRLIRLACGPYSGGTSMYSVHRNSGLIQFDPFEIKKKQDVCVDI